MLKKVLMGIVAACILGQFTNCEANSMKNVKISYQSHYVGDIGEI